MKIGYARISKADDSQKLDLQLDALIEAGVKEDHIYSDKITGARSDRPGLAACLKALRKGDTLIVWALDRLGRNLRHLINIVQELNDRQISFKVLTGQGAVIDTSTPHGKLIFHIFGALAEHEREMIRERTRAGIKAARARGRMGGRKHKLTKNQIRYAASLMQNKETIVSDLCNELNISKATLYRYVAPNGELREQGRQILEG